MRHAMYLPSGEYSGVESLPGEVEIFFGVPPVIGTMKISLFVLLAGTSSMLLVNASSFPSGETAYMSCPPSENGGASWSPGVRSFAPPPAAGTTKMCVTFPIGNVGQCRKNRCVQICAFTFDALRSSSLCLLHASSLQSGYTSDVNTIFCPSGDHIAPLMPPDIVMTPLAPPEIVVTFLGFAASCPVASSNPAT